MADSEYSLAAAVQHIAWERADAATGAWAVKRLEPLAAGDVVGKSQAELEAYKARWSAAALREGSLGSCALVGTCDFFFSFCWLCLGVDFSLVLAGLAGYIYSLFVFIYLFIFFFSFSFA